MISFPGFDVSKYGLDITEHALVRAEERGIEPELVLQAFQGKVVRFGKHGIRFVCRGKRTITCVGEIKGNVIRIFTVELG